MGDLSVERYEQLNIVGDWASLLKKKKDRAINARKQSGIEEIWAEDEAHYESKDKNVNSLTKSSNLNDPITSQKTTKSLGRSTAFVDITRPYVDAGAARIADMLLPTDHRNWELVCTPIPTLVKNTNDHRPVFGQDGNLIEKKSGVFSKIGDVVRGMFGGKNGDESPHVTVADLSPHVTVADLAQKQIDDAKNAASRAQSVIDDWHVESNYQAEERKVIESAALLGVGVLKGPYPEKRIVRAVTKTEFGWQMTLREEVKPVSKCISPWNFYPDPNCGDDIKNGSYVFERDDITARKLSELKGGDYIDEMIDICLEEGPNGEYENARNRGAGDNLSDDDLFEIWYFHGAVSKKEMLAAGCECENDFAPCIVTMVNDHIIKCCVSPLDSGEFPYQVMVWQRKLNHWAGIGIARQIRTSQKGLNAAVREMMNNLSLSAGPQIIYDSSLIEPADGVAALTPRKLWRKKPETEDLDVRKAFSIVSIETRQAEILNTINYWTKQAEDATGLPMLLQGQQGRAPETVGGMTMLNNNANSVLRRIARMFDDLVTSRSLLLYYEWLLINGPENAKGDFQIQPRGSSALVERDAQNQAMIQLLNASLNQSYGVDPERVMTEFLKGMRLDPRSFNYDEEKKKQMSQQPPPPLPQVQVAQINAEAAAQRQQADLQAKMQIEQIRHQEAMEESAIDRQFEMTKLQAEQEIDRMNLQIKKMQIEVQGQLEAAQLSAQQQQTLDQIKADLSGLSMKLRVQTDLSKQVVTPPTEPNGRAPNGEAFQR